MLIVFGEDRQNHNKITIFKEYNRFVLLFLSNFVLFFRALDCAHRRLSVAVRERPSPLSPFDKMYKKKEDAEKTVSALEDGGDEIRARGDFYCVLFSASIER